MAFKMGDRDECLECFSILYGKDCTAASLQWRLYIYNQSKTGDKLACTIVLCIDERIVPAGRAFKSERNKSEERKREHKSTKLKMTPNGITPL